MKRVAEAEHKLVVEIPGVVRIRPVVVEPQTVFIVFHVEDVRVAVPVGMCAAPPVSLAGSNRRRRIYAAVSYSA